MNDNNINEELFDHHRWAPDIPSPDMAWSDMRDRLDKEFPVIEATGKTGKQKYLSGNKICIVILLLLLPAIRHTKENSNTQRIKLYPAKGLSAGVRNDQRLVPRSGNELLADATQKDKLEKSNLNNVHAHKPYKIADKNFALNTGKRFAQKERDTIPKKGKAVLQDTATISTTMENSVLINTNSGHKKQKSVVVLPGDSLQDIHEQDNKNKLGIQAGLQWTMQIPIAGTGHYFAGPNANKQPLRQLLPGVWISFEADKNILMAEVNPFATASFNPKSFYTIIETVDTQTIRETTKLLTKVFGIAGSVSYQQNIRSNWWAGGGLQGNFWKKGVSVRTVKQYSSSSTITTYSSQSEATSNSDWKYFSKFQLYPYAQLMYRSTNYQAGLRAGATFTSFAKENGNKNLLFTEVFFRIPLLSNDKKAK